MTLMFQWGRTMVQRYRDDGLGVMKGIGGPERERRKKKIIQIFKSHKLDITVQTNLHTVQYLDVEFDLKGNTYKPYRKPNNDPLYVNAKSNHPPSILKQIPKGIGKRLSEISSCEEVFKAAAPLYEEALKSSGYREKLVYTSSTPNNTNTQRKKARRRKIIWYNPPFSINVKTNIGKEFLKLVQTHFHGRHKFHKIFNKSNVKISYSCMRNISSVISGHNKSILRKPRPILKECNCRNRGQCPMGNKCLTDNIVYEAEITSRPDNVVKDYRGLCSTSFKDRFRVHEEGFKFRRYAKGCELSKYVWDLKDNEKGYDIKWKILKKVNGRLVGGACKLCTTETMLINGHSDKSRLLNKNSINKCVHETKYMLSQIGLKPRTRTRARGNGNDSMD